MNTEITKEKIQGIANRMKSLRYKPISDHDEVWYFGWLGMLNRGKYKVAKRFNSFCFRKKKDAVKFNTIKRELFDEVCDLVDKEMENSLYENVSKFRDIRTIVNSSDLVENNISELIHIVDASPLRSVLNSSEMKLRAKIFTEKECASGKNK